IGRAVLRAAGTPPVVVTSTLAHPSVHKAAQLADLTVVPLPTSGTDRTTAPTALADTLAELYDRTVTGYIVVSTVGYFGTGSVDDVPALCDVIVEHRSRHPETRFYHHIDAAFGGLVLPFTDPSCGWDFRNRGVHSVAVDPHKTGLLPYSCGVFLCRKGLLEHVALTAHPSGVVDEPLLGSRPGAAAAARGCGGGAVGGADGARLRGVPQRPHRVRRPARRPARRRTRDRPGRRAGRAPADAGAGGELFTTWTALTPYGGAAVPVARRSAA